jgi:hypothetical protein
VHAQRLLGGARRAIPAGVACAALAATAGCGSGGERATVTPPTRAARARVSLAKLPMAFERNRGQAPARFAYVARGSGYALGLGRGGADLVLARGKRSGGALVRVQAAGGRLGVPVAQRRLRGVVNSYRNATAVAGAPTYGRVAYRDVWPGVDVAFHGDQRALEYDFDLAAHADPARIGLRFAGARSARADGHGGAVVSVDGGGRLRLSAPHTVQDGRPIASRLTTDGATVRVALGAYDRSRPLTVDPGLDYGTYLGGSTYDSGRAIAVGGDGSAYVAGATQGSFPTTPGVFQPTYGDAPGAGASDAYVAKLSPDGSAVDYATYLGGNETDSANGIAVDQDGNAYVTGDTASSTFPTSSGAYQTTYGGDYHQGNTYAYAAKLTATGQRAYATFLEPSTVGNQSYGQGIAVGTGGDAYVTGKAGPTYPVTAGALQTTYAGGPGGDAVVTELNASGTGLVYSTYLGGSGSDLGNAVAVDATGAAYVAGTTDGGFPTTGGAAQATFGGGASGGDGDAFVAKLNPAGSALAYASYLGGTGIDKSGAIALDGSDDAYVAGTTTGSFPVSGGAAQTVYGGGGGGIGGDAFVAKVNAAGSAFGYVTYLGGTSDDIGAGIAVDAAGSAYVAGTAGPGFPTTPDAYQGSDPSYDAAYVARLAPGGDAVAYSTYLGGTGGADGSGIALDGAGGVYVIGDTTGTMPVTAGAAQPAGGGSADAYVAKLSLAPARPSATALSCAPGAVQAGAATTCTATVTDAGSGGTPTTPSGAVTLSTGGSGAFSAATCTLVAGSCSVQYTPSEAGSGTHHLGAAYAGDVRHDPSAGSADVAVSAAPAQTTPVTTPGTVAPPATTATTAGTTTTTTTTTTTATTTTRPKAPTAAQVATALRLPAATRCVSARTLTLHLAKHVELAGRRETVKRVTVKLGARTVATTTKLTIRVRLASVRQRSFTVTVTATTASGKRFTGTRTYRRCAT